MPDTTGSADIPNTAPHALSPGAAALVEAGKQLLVDGGIDALRVGRITSTAGQNRAMVNYYFGSKAAMVAVVVDSLIHEAVEELVTETEQLPRGESRVGAHVENTLRLMQTPEFLSTIDVIPAARRSDDLRDRVARLYDWYREMNAECLDPEAHQNSDERLSGLAALFVAVFDGLAIQWALDPEAFDQEQVAGLLGEMFSFMLRPKDEPRAG
jgi:AcrR family transcriptional regulator